MMRSFLSVLLVGLFLSLQVSAQLLVTSTLQVDDGDTLVLSRTTNRLGATSYVTVSTVNGAGAAAATTATTAAAEETTTLRVVGQEDTATRPNTVFQYTTTNAAGAKVVRTSTFTPSFAPTLVPAEPSSGTRFDYSEYASIIGPSLSAQFAASLAAQTAGASRSVSLFGPGAVGLLVGGLLAGAGALFVGLA